MPKFISVTMKNKMENSILKDNLGDLITSNGSLWLDSQNKLNDPPHVRQIVWHAIQPSLILTQSRKVERVITTTLRVTRVARRGVMKRLCILTQPFLDYELYLLPIILCHSPRTRRNDDIPISNSILRSYALFRVK